METKVCRILDPDVLVDAIRLFKDSAKNYSFQSTVLVKGAFEGNSYSLNGNDHHLLPELTIELSSQEDLIKAYFTHNYVSQLAELDRLYAISLFVKKGYDYSLLNMLLDHVGINYFEGLVEKSMKLIRLDSEVLKFIVSKQFSLKQAFSLCRYDSSFLEWMLNLSFYFHMSSSHFIELSDACYRLSKQSQCDDYNAFFQLECIQDSIASSTNHHFRTSCLREKLLQSLNPVQTQVNKQLKSLASQVSGSMTLNWDKSLENKQIDVTMRLTDDSQCEALSDSLKKSRGIIQSMLDLL
ncbi:hypothetical protein DID78_05330 [Candidatus Marinamargulisbacteria bacterium SCGC AG-343-D04]|nr:hypothetical protein DID78_05330 [Candidatus Marinamargulisbacteria bacterium SCGC AG-343-D04]